MRLAQMPLLWVLLAAFSLLAPTRARGAEGDASLVLQSAPDLSAYVGKSITRITFVTEVGRWSSAPVVEHASVGEWRSAELVRRV
jgi:hypothetical protein